MDLTEALHCDETCAAPSGEDSTTIERAAALVAGTSINTSNTTETIAASPHLLGIPNEMLNDIITQCVVTPHNTPKHSECDVPCRSKFSRKACVHVSRANDLPALALTCAVFRAKVLPVYYGQHWYVVDINDVQSFFQRVREHSSFSVVRRLRVTLGSNRPQSTTTPLSEISVIRCVDIGLEDQSNALFALRKTFHLDPLNYKEATRTCSPCRRNFKAALNHINSECMSDLDSIDSKRPDDKILQFVKWLEDSWAKGRWSSPYDHIDPNIFETVQAKDDSAHCLICGGREVKLIAAGEEFVNTASQSDSVIG